MFSRLRLLSVLLGVLVARFVFAEPPSGYVGRSFSDAFHKADPARIPGLLQCALYDLGGEGVAYHDTDSTNNGSGRLNREAGHQRAHAGEYVWHFREGEGVDLSFVKDWADLNHTNLVAPPINQHYIGWTEDGEWCRYTVRVERAGTYRIRALYAYQTNRVEFEINGRPAASCRLPVATASYHHWNLAEIGTIAFPEAGLQVLTFRYGKGNNFAWFEFVPAAHSDAAAASVGVDGTLWTEDLLVDSSKHFPTPAVGPTPSTWHDTRPFRHGGSGRVTAVEPVQWLSPDPAEFP